jgi:transposase
MTAALGGEAAKTGGVGRQTVRDWVLAFNTKGPPGLVNGKAPGNPPLLTPAHRQALLEIVESARSRRFTAWFAGG